MKSQKTKSEKKEIMWAIGGKFGWYCGTWLTRKDAIESRCSITGKTWGQCREKGDYASKVVLQVVK